MPRDENLMQGVRDGDLNAFEQLVLRHQDEAWPGRVFPLT